MQNQMGKVPTLCKVKGPWVDASEVATGSHFMAGLPLSPRFWFWSQALQALLQMQGGPKWIASSNRL